jgi:hypothetical protein
LPLRRNNGERQAQGDLPGNQRTRYGGTPPQREHLLQQGGTGPPALGVERARERVELRSPERLEKVLLENGREDEKASAGVHCPAASPDHALFGGTRVS